MNCYVLKLKARRDMLAKRDFVGNMKIIKKLDRKIRNEAE